MKKTPFNSLSLRISGLVILLLIVPSGITLNIYKNKLDEELRKEGISAITVGFREKVKRFHDSLDLMKGNLQSVATHLSTESLHEDQEMARKVRNVRPEAEFFESDLYRGMLMTMSAELKVSNYYTKLRVINASGDEIARIDNVSGDIIPTPVEKLQNKSHREYFQHMIKHEKEGIHVEPPTLNYEYGKLTYPLLLVLRVSQKLYLENGELFGLVVMSVNMDTFFDDFRKENKKNIMVINDAGTYLYHHDQALLFGDELHQNKDANFFRTFSPLKEQIAQNLAGINFDKQSGEYSIWNKFFYDLDNKKQYLTLLMRFPEESLVSSWALIINDAYYVLLLLNGLSLVFLFFIMSTVVKPLNKLMSSLKNIAKGHYQERIAVEGTKEVMEIGNTFNDMAGKIEKMQKELLRRVNLSETIASVAPNAFFVINEAGIILSVNPRVEMIFGYTAEELVGQNISVLMPSPYREQHGEYIGNYILTGVSRIMGKYNKLTALRKGGEHFPVAVYIGESKAGEERVFVGIVEDLSSQETIREELDITKMAVDASPELVLWVDKMGVIKYANEATSRCLGYENAALMGMSFFDVSLQITSDSWKKVTEGIREEGSLNIEGYFLTHDEMTVVVDMIIYPVKSYENLYVVFARDITERKRMEDGLRILAIGMTEGEEGDYFENLVQNFAVTMNVEYALVCKLEGEGEPPSVLSSYNALPALEGFMLDTKAPACKKTVEEGFLHLSNDLKDFFPHDPQFAGSGLISYIGVSIKDWNGDTFGFLAGLSPREIPRTPITHSIIQIFSDKASVEFKRKEKEMELRRSEEKYRSLMNDASEGIILTDIMGNPIEANKMALELLGYSMEELMKTNIDTVITSREKGGRAFNSVVSIISKKTSIHLDDIYAVRMDGSKLPINITGSLISFGDKFVVQIIFRDITELIRVVKRLEETNREIKGFANIVSHDLRSPLVNLKGFTSELSLSLAELRKVLADIKLGAERKRVDEILEKDVPESINYLEISTSKMEKLITEILNFSRLGTMKMNPVRIDVEAFVNSLLKTYQHQIEKGGIEVVVDELPVIHADEIVLGQIFGNILTNAINYLQPGRPGKIIVSSEDLGDRYKFSIQDNGRGIAERDVHKVFEIFRRAGLNTVKGEGMGMSYVKALVERMGGEINFSSVEGEGTVFFFVIPKGINIDA